MTMGHFRGGRLIEEKSEGLNALDNCSDHATLSAS